MSVRSEGVPGGGGVKTTPPKETHGLVDHAHRHKSAAATAQGVKWHVTVTSSHRHDNRGGALLCTYPWQHARPDEVQGVHPVCKKYSASTAKSELPTHDDVTRTAHTHTHTAEERQLLNERSDVWNEKLLGFACRPEQRQLVFGKILWSKQAQSPHNVAATRRPSQCVVGTSSQCSPEASTETAKPSASSHTPDRPRRRL